MDVIHQHSIVSYKKPFGIKTSLLYISFVIIIVILVFWWLGFTFLGLRRTFIFNLFGSCFLYRVYAMADYCKCMLNFNRSNSNTISS